MSPVANRFRAYLPPQVVQPSGSIAEIADYLGVSVEKKFREHLLGNRGN